jgi:hypothetical protein
MIFTGDTKPNYYVIDQATKGVDVLIHELVVPPEVWAEKNSDICPPPPLAVTFAQEIQDSSHTPEKAFGYILSQLKVPPRLAVATHFQATDDTIEHALKDIRLWYPNGEVTFACDLLMLNVTKTGFDTPGTTKARPGAVRPPGRRQSRRGAFRTSSPWRGARDGRTASNETDPLPTCHAACSGDGQ